MTSMMKLLLLKLMKLVTRTGPWPRMRPKVKLTCQLMLTLRLAMKARHGPLLVPALRVSQSRMLNLTQKDLETPKATQAPTWTLILKLALTLMTTHWPRLVPRHKPSSGGFGKEELQLGGLPQLEPLESEQQGLVQRIWPDREQLLPGHIT